MSTLLEKSPAKIIQYLLVEKALGVLPTPTSPGTWPVYADNEPPTPDNVITVYDTDGLNQGRSMIDGQLFEKLGFQVRVRSVDHATGWLKVSNIRNTLATGVYQDTVAVGDYRFLVHAIVRIGRVLRIGREPTSQRRLFTVNAMTHIRQL